MRTLTLLAVALAAAAAIPTAAEAVTCYTLLDRNDKLLYQASSPPVDMSDQGAAARDGLRRHRDYLIVADVDSCPQVAAVAGTTGYRPATVAEIVSEMRGYLSYGGISSLPGQTRSGSVGGGGGGGGGGGSAAGGGSSVGSGGMRGRY